MTSAEKQWLADMLKETIADEWKKVSGQSNAEITEAVRFWTHRVNNVSRDEYTLAMLEVYQEEDDLRTGAYRECTNCGAWIVECECNSNC